VAARCPLVPLSMMMLVEEVPRMALLRIYLAPEAADVPAATLR
jgi:hypothetical protein